MSSTGPLKIYFDWDEHDGIDVLRIYCKEDPERPYIKEHIWDYMADNFDDSDRECNGRYRFTGEIVWTQDYWGDWDEEWCGELKLIHKAEDICYRCKENGPRTDLCCEPCRTVILAEMHLD